MPENDVLRTQLQNALGDGQGCVAGKLLDSVADVRSRNLLLHEAVDGYKSTHQKPEMQLAVYSTNLRKVVSQDPFGDGDRLVETPELYISVLAKPAQSWTASKIYQENTNPKSTSKTEYFCEDLKK